VLPLVALLAANRQGKLVRAFAASAFALLALSFAMIGSKGVGTYLGLLSSMNRPPLSAYAQPGPMPNLRGLILHWLSGYPEMVPLAILVVSVVVFGSVLLILPGNERGTRFDVFFACSTTACYLIGYHGYEHDMAIMFPGLLLVANACAKYRGAGWRVYCGLGLLLLFLPALYIRLYFTLRLSLMCLPILLLFISLLFASRARATEPAQSA
jgi:hypothetical protein